MYSDRSPRRGSRGLASRTLLPLLLTTAVASLLAGCGVKGDPRPPLRDVPERATDFALRLQGRLILFELSGPRQTVDGLPLGGFDALELWQMSKPVSTETAPPVDAAEFEASASEALTLKGAELQSARLGERIQLRVPLAAELPEEPTALYFAVRVVKNADSSAFSNIVGLIPREPPPAPRNLAAAARASFIELSWESDEAMEGFDVFRRRADERGYGEPIGSAPGDQLSYRDTTARYGERYIYTVRAAARRQPLIWSDEAGEREIDYLDRFAPPLPANFVALGERGRTRLRWEAAVADDVAGYHLWRREPRREQFGRITSELVTVTEYLDRGLVAGFSYEYRIQVVDQEGNESELSDPPVTAAVR